MRLSHAVHEPRDALLAGSQALGQARAAERRHTVVLVQEELTKVGIGKARRPRIRSAREHREAERRPFLHIAQDAADLGQIETVPAIHGVPANRLHERVARGGEILLADTGEGEVGVEPRERDLDLHELARVLLNAAIRQALEGIVEGEPLAVLGIGAGLRSPVLNRARELLELRKRGFYVAGCQIALGTGDILSGHGQVHVYLPVQSYQCSARRHGGQADRRREPRHRRAAANS